MTGMRELCFACSARGKLEADEEGVAAERKPKSLDAQSTRFRMQTVLATVIYHRYPQPDQRDEKGYIRYFPGFVLGFKPEGTGIVATCDGRTLRGHMRQLQPDTDFSENSHTAEKNLGNANQGSTSPQG